MGGANSPHIFRAESVQSDFQLHGKCPAWTGINTGATAQAVPAFDRRAPCADNGLKDLGIGETGLLAEIALSAGLVIDPDLDQPQASNTLVEATQRAERSAPDAFGPEEFQDYDGNKGGKAGE